jgi:methylisocitrate lyase
MDGVEYRSTDMHISSAVILKRRERDPVKLFREELRRPGIVMVPGVFNALTAMLAEKMGFRAVYVSGAAVTASLGLPDLGIITLDEMVKIVGYICDSVGIPVIVDIDTGYGEALNVVRAVREFEKVGAAAVQIEDQVLPKKCGHLSGKQLITPYEMARKIRAAAEARGNPDFAIIARTDARGVTGLEDAVRRAEMYLEAGADVIFPEALESEEEFAEFASRVRAPLLANMTEFGRSPLIEASKLEGMGYKLVIYPVTLLRVAMYSVKKALSLLRERGTQRELVPEMFTRKELYELIGYHEYEEFDKKIFKDIKGVD